MRNIDELIEHLKYVYVGIRPRVEEDKTPSIYQYLYLEDGTLAIRHYGDWTWTCTGTNDFQKIKNLILPIIGIIHNDIEFYNIYGFYG